MEHIIVQSEIKLPSVRVESTADDVIVDEADNLPLGAQLTGALKLREEGRTGKGVRVAVIDSGVDKQHPGFNGKVAKQMWFRYEEQAGDHGTHVAGTIHLMAPDAEIYDYRVFGTEGWDTTSAIQTSIYEAVFDGCDVINMSLGGRWPTSAIRTAIQFAHKKGVIVVCAAGNEGDGNPLTNERSYPAMWPEVSSIAAVAKDEDLPVTRFSNTNANVDYAGIGADVISFKPEPEGGFQTMSGTSMACPHVAGLIAALLSGEEEIAELAKNEEKQVNLNKILRAKYAIDIGEEGRDVETGNGFLTYLTKEEFKSMWSE